MASRKTTPQEQDASFKVAESRAFFLPLICCALVGLTLCAFWPLSHAGFINYDDPDYVTENPHVQSGITQATVKWAFTTMEASNWHPLTWLSHALDWQLFGASPVAHHVVSLSIHAANSALLFLLLLKLLGASKTSNFKLQTSGNPQSPGAKMQSENTINDQPSTINQLWNCALIAALFAVHPAHVESVAWISERKDVLSAFFFLLTILAYTRYARTTGPQDHGTTDNKTEGLKSHWFMLSKVPSSIFYLLSLLLFALGLLSKPMLVTTPFLLLLLDFWPLRRFRPSTLKSQPSTVPKPRTTEYGLRTNELGFPTLLLEKLPFVLLSAASCAITMYAQSRGGAVKDALPLYDRIANAAVAYMRYIGIAIWPTNLAIIYPHPGQWPAPLAVICGCAVVGISIAAIVLRRKLPYCFVGWFWFAGMLVPVIGLVQVGFQSIADRYTYLPFIGLFLILARGADGLLSRSRSIFHVSRFTFHAVPSTLQVAACAVIVLCALATRQQVRYWHDSGTLFTHAIAVTKNNFLAHNHLGVFLADTGHPTEAINQYEESARINPDFGETHNNLGAELARVGRINDAELHLRRAIELNPRFAAAHYNLGQALTVSGRAAEAIPEFEQALNLNCPDRRVHLNLARAYCLLGRFQDGVMQYREAMRTGMAGADVRIELAGALGEIGQRDEARRECEEVLKLSPGYKPALDLLKALDGRR